MKNIILLATVLSLFSAPMNAPAFAEVKTYGDGYIEMIEGLPVLHVKGSEYEMGKQYGYLAGDRIAANIENLKQMGNGQVSSIKLIPDVLFRSLRKLIGWVFWLTFPRNVKDHIKGIVAGARENSVQLNKYDVAFVNSVIDIVGIANASGSSVPGTGEKSNEKSATEQSSILKILGLSRFGQQCDSLAVWGSRTQGGKTFQTRNTDITTGTGIEKYPLIVIYKADGKIPLITASFSGMVGAFTGMNAEGVALGQVWAFSQDIKLATPWNIVMRKYLMEQSSAKAVVGEMAKWRTTTYGNNFVVADAGNSANPSETAFAVEMTGKNFALFHENDQRELLVKYQGVPYAYPIPEAVYRGDVSFDQQIRSRQKSGNGPDGDPRETSSYNQRYKGQYDRIMAYAERGIKIGQEEAEAISRETAIRGSSLQTAVYANTDRDFWVSYSKMNEDGTVTQANEQKYINIPFYQYLVTLHEDRGVVSVENLLQKNRNLVLRYQGQEMNLSLDHKTKVQTGITLARGEWAEIYDGDRLVDRVVRY